MLGDGLFRQDTVTLALADAAPLNGPYPVNVIGPADTKVHPVAAQATWAHTVSMSAIARRVAHLRLRTRSQSCFLVSEEKECARAPGTMFVRLQ
jgi:hypothetical protein